MSRIFPVTLGLMLALAGCGTPDVEPPPQASTNSSSGGGSSTSLAFHDGGAMPFEVTGDGFVEVLDDKNIGDMRALRLVMFMTEAPKIGKVYVWWMRSPAGKPANFGVLPYEDQPYKPSFEVIVGDPGDGSPPHIANFNGTFITYEDEDGAEDLKNPVGPLVWSGEQAIPVWSHVNHVLTALDKNIGLIQQSNTIMGALKAQLDQTKAAIKANKEKLARVHVEDLHTLLIGEKDASDLTGDGSFSTDLCPFSMGLAGAESPLREAVKHAGFALKAIQELGSDPHQIEEAYVKMMAASDAFNSKVVTGLDSMNTYASGGNSDFKAVNEAVSEFLKHGKEALEASLLMSRIELKP